MKLAFVLTLLVTCATAGTIHPRLNRQPLAELDGRITNGDVSSRTQFPYQVGLSLQFADGEAWCGGTLVSNLWIVTAAHCTEDALGVIIYLGAFNIKNDKELGQQRVHVSKSNIYTHEDYDGTTISNDIAVIKMPIKIEFNEYIQPAVLPKRADLYSSYVGDTVVASGWGLDSDVSTSVSDVLNYINTTVISQSSCNLRYFGLIKSSNLCISGKDGRSICSGDSGGPLVYHNNGENLLIGATSFGIALGCEKGWPGVFTRITSYLDWIDGKTGLVK